MAKTPRRLPDSNANYLANCFAGGFTGSSPPGASDISFFSGGQGSASLVTAKFVSGSSGELVPVPEASTLMGVLGLMAPLAWRERRHWMRCRAARG